MPNKYPYIVRFFQKVDMDSESGCWNWTGYRNRDNGSRFLGYGRIRYYDHRQWLAHRVSYDLMVGPIPEGMTIDHLCSNPSCVNPDHLEAVTQRENTLRGNNPFSINARKTECVHGHPYTAKSTYRPPTGGRECRICRSAASLKRDQEKRAAEKAA